MTIGDSTPIRGYVTKDKFLRGRTLNEIEGYLGFHPGRLRQGARFAAATRLPDAKQFELAAYSMTAAHRHQTPIGLDISKLKALAIESWSLAGGDRLIKVLPTIGHDPFLSDDEQYPPGSGVPQWRILPEAGIPGIIVADLKTASDTYVPRL